MKKDFVQSIIDVGSGFLIAILIQIFIFPDISLVQPAIFRICTLNIHLIKYISDHKFDFVKSFGGHRPPMIFLRGPLAPEKFKLVLY